MDYLTYAIRVIVVFPFVLACALIWAVLGLIFWIPTLTFALIAFQFSIFRNLASGRRTTSEIKRVEASANYYSQGFRIILGVLSARTESSSGKNPGFLDDFKQIATPLLKKCMEAAAAWAIILFLLWTTGLGRSIEGWFKSLAWI